jgi:hypothetical protein
MVPPCRARATLRLPCCFFVVASVKISFCVIWICGDANKIQPSFFASFDERAGSS